MPKKEVKRESWGSSMGFMLAAIGSAVGLGTCGDSRISWE